MQSRREQSAGVPFDEGERAVLANDALIVSSDEEPLRHWRQGDFAIDVGGFLFAEPSDDEFAFSAAEEPDDSWGLIVVSQTCDIVRATSGRDHVAVCPLIKRPAAELSEIRKGKRPNLVQVENAPSDVFADLARIMSISKSLLATWDRVSGFDSDQTRSRFAAALERKFGRFAFPDEFDAAIKSFRDRVWRRHDKAQSEVGQVYRSLAEIRFKANPSWDADQREITVLAILQPEGLREANRDVIQRELEGAIGKIQLPNGYVWATPTFYLASAADLTGEDILSSDRADFDFLCA